MAGLDYNRLQTAFSGFQKKIWMGATPIKRFPTPVAKPYAPFFFAALLVGWTVSKLQTMAENSDEWRNDPRATRVVRNTA